VRTTLHEPAPATAPAEVWVRNTPEMAVLAGLCEHLFQPAQSVVASGANASKVLVALELAKQPGRKRVIPFALRRVE
jgi:hypothetical protein